MQHVGHESGEHHFRPHMPSFIHDHGHGHNHVVPNEKPTVRIYTKAETNYSLTIRDGMVVLAHANPGDPFQVSPLLFTYFLYVIYLFASFRQMFCYGRN